MDWTAPRHRSPSMPKRQVTQQGGVPVKCDVAGMPTGTTAHGRQAPVHDMLMCNTTRQVQETMGSDVMTQCTTYSAILHAQVSYSRYQSSQVRPGLHGTWDLKPGSFGLA